MFRAKSFRVVACLGLALTITCTCFGYVTERELTRRQQTGPFLQPNQFLDPSFQSQGSGSNGGSPASNSTSSMMSANSQFIPTFLDPSKFSNFGQQNGSSSSSGGTFGPSMFMNPAGANGGQNSTGNFNFFDPSKFLQG